jgi:ketosteroid isomerase-like protein
MDGTLSDHLRGAGPAADEFAAVHALSQRGAGRSWWPALFAAIDARDADRFVAFLTSDAQFRFGNGPLLCGQPAIRAAVAGFFGAIRACQHRIIGIWSEAGSFVCEGEVTYTRLDGARVTVPFVNVMALQDHKISIYRIYIDNTPLFAPATPGIAAGD